MAGYQACSLCEVGGKDVYLSASNALCSDCANECLAAFNGERTNGGIKPRGSTAECSFCGQQNVETAGTSKVRICAGCLNQAYTIKLNEAAFAFGQGLGQLARFGYEAWQDRQLRKRVVCDVEQLQGFTSEKATEETRILAYAYDAKQWACFVDELAKRRLTRILGVAKMARQSAQQ